MTCVGIKISKYIIYTVVIFTFYAFLTLTTRFIIEFTNAFTIIIVTINNNNITLSTTNITHNTTTIDMHLYDSVYFYTAYNTLIL